jgi:hypothetical protein
MAAGLGFKDFTTGEVLTAADVDGYLMQGIWVFASNAARDAAVTAPAEGNFAFTKDTNSLWYYDGAAWVASGATGDIEGVTAGVGISGGGTSGTVTVTNSMATAIDAKGDLIVGTGADTFSRLAVGGTNGHVLTVDSGETTGLKWAAAGGGGSSTFVGCKVFIGAAQSIANATLVTVTYSNEEFDTDGFHSTSSNTDRITIPSGKDGYYLVNWTVNFADNATGYRTSQVLKNGLRIGYGNWTDAISGDPTVTSNSVILNLDAGDYLTIQVAQTSSGSLNLSVSSPVAQQDNNFSVTYLGA